MHRISWGLVAWSSWLRLTSLTTTWLHVRFVGLAASRSLLEIGLWIALFSFFFGIFSNSKHRRDPITTLFHARITFIDWVSTASGNDHIILWWNGLIIIGGLLSERRIAQSMIICGCISGLVSLLSSHASSSQPTPNLIITTAFNQIFPLDVSKI